MQVSGKGSEQLKSIARSNRGKYRDVSPAAGSAQMARQNPIRRNKSRGKVWGITLPVGRKEVIQDLWLDLLFGIEICQNQFFLGL